MYYGFGGLLLLVLLIVHGSVVLAVDESATRTFARASAAMRWQARRSAVPAAR